MAQSPAGSALKGALERRSSHSALRSRSPDSQGLPGAGLISVLTAEPGPGPDRYNQKIYRKVRLNFAASAQPPILHRANQGNQCGENNWKHCLN
ncbi:unnamed protein product [Arctogadus glacialis]